MVLANVIFLATLMIMIYSRKFRMVGTAYLFVLWIFVSPLMVLAVSSGHTLALNQSYKQTTASLKYITSTLTVIAFMMAGGLAYS